MFILWVRHLSKTQSNVERITYKYWRYGNQDIPQKNYGTIKMINSHKQKGSDINWSKWFTLKPIYHKKTTTTKKNKSKYKDKKNQKQNKQKFIKHIQYPTHYTLDKYVSVPNFKYSPPQPTICFVRYFLVPFPFTPSPLRHEKPIWLDVIRNVCKFLVWEDPWFHVRMA